MNKQDQITAQTVDAILPDFLVLTNLTFNQFMADDFYRTMFADMVALNIAHCAA